MQVLYHVLGVVPAYQASIGPALNELSLGLQPDEVAPVCPLKIFSNCFYNVIMYLIIFLMLSLDMCIYRLYMGYMQKMFMLEWPA